MIRYVTRPCALGIVLVAASARGICWVSLGDDADTLVTELRDHLPAAEPAAGERGIEALLARVAAAVECPGSGAAEDLVLDIGGSAFQRTVWEELRAIAPGTTASYAEIAVRIGHPGSARAVAGACAANRIAVLIPCHRVVRADGSLSGYRWGGARKHALLERERALTPLASASRGGDVAGLAR